MLGRRSLLAGAAAVAVVRDFYDVPGGVVSTPVVERATLDLVPCDGRWLPCADYLDLYEEIGGRYGFDANTFRFRVPDARGRYASQLVAAMEGGQQGEARMTIMPHIGTGHGNVPAGFILLKAARHG